MKLKIGNVELDNNLVLAPMAGVTDMSFRQLPGAGLRPSGHGDGERQGHSL